MGQQFGQDKGYVEYITRVEEDSTTANTFYVGQARPRTASSAAAWRIKRVVVTDPVGSGTVAVVTGWARGDDRFENIWDNRQSLSYS